MLLFDGPSHVPGCQGLTPFPNGLFLSSVPIQDAPLQQLFFPPSKMYVFKCFAGVCTHAGVCAGASGGQRGPGVVVHHEPPCDC